MSSGCPIYAPQRSAGRAFEIFDWRKPGCAAPSPPPLSPFWVLRQMPTPEFSQWSSWGPTAIRACGRSPRMPARRSLRRQVGARERTRQPGRSFGNVKASQFPVRSCEAMVPPDAVAAVRQQRPCRCRGQPQRILVFGDTAAARRQSAGLQRHQFLAVPKMPPWRQPPVGYGNSSATITGRTPPDRPCGLRRPLRLWLDAWNADFFAGGACSRPPLG